MVQEDLTGIRVVKSFVREDYEEEKFAKRNGDLKESSMRAFGMVVINMPVMMLVVYSTIIAVMWFGGKMVYAGTLPVGDLTAFFTYITQILMSLMMVSMMFMMMTRSIACAKRIVEVLEERPAITDDSAKADAAVKDGSIDFDHVFFKYSETSPEWVLKDVNIHIPSGATVGILGGTGSGKTSLMSLIPRLYEAQEGTVSVGGRPVADYTMEHLRESVSVVLQKNTLFSGTIRENLLWGDPNATEDQLWAACRAACADEFLERMPDGLDTDLGQGGVNVSGGQKQRLCIARAILKKPKVLILDDSTSAVDTATDAKIRQAFRQDLPGTTKLIVAQRVTSVMDADLILVMDDGAVAAQGTHEELMKTCEIYREVYESQQEGVSIGAENNTKRGSGHGPGGPRGGFRKPKDLRGTLSKLMGYLGRYKALLVIVMILLFISAACSVAGSYLIKPSSMIISSPAILSALPKCSVSWRGSTLWGRCAPTATPRSWSMWPRTPWQSSGRTCSTKCRSCP